MPFSRKVRIPSLCQTPRELFLDDWNFPKSPPVS
jgi:hypothetical protein